MTERFLWSDVWVLQAVIAASSQASPSPLDTLIATADAINHAVLTREELNGALGRLSRAGYIAASAAGAVELTPAGLALVRAAAWPRTWHAQGEALARELGATPWSAASDPAAAGEGEPELITLDVYEAAVASYLGRHHV
jgi:hypothetical protein